MSRSFNARRPFVRKTKSIVRRAGEDLISKAGRASMERPTIEQLEPRKLLFSLTIDGSQFDNFGRPMAEAYFAYFVPYLLSPDPPDDPNPGDALTEDFNDEAIGQIFPGTQRVLQGSNILARNNNAQFVEILAPLDGTGQPQTDLQVLHSTMGISGQSYSLSTLADPNQPGGLRNVYLSLSFNVTSQTGNASAGNNFGLLNGGLEIQTLFQGTVQRTFTQADLTAQNAGGLGTFRVDAVGGDIGAFDEVRFVQTQTAFVDPGVVTSDFFLDDLVYTPPGGQFGAIINNRVFGAYVRVTGEIGSTVQLNDLYGRDIRQTIQLGAAGSNVNFAFGDFNGDGIPEYNDGIGQVNISNTGDGTTPTSVYMAGGIIQAFGVGAPPQNAEFIEGGFAWLFANQLSINDQFDQRAGFGFIPITANNARDVSGLPEQSAQLIIGSPFDRPLNNYNPGGLPTGATDFTRNDQGIFLTDGSSIDSVITNANLFGSSRFDGSVGTLGIGVNFSDVTVAGDLGSFVVATDSGLWEIDPDDAVANAANGQVNTFGSELSVGRSLGEFSVGGRNLTSIVIDGDLSSPVSAPPRDVLLHDEREAVFEIDPANPLGLLATLRQSREGFFINPIVTQLGVLDFDFKVANALAFGDNYLRNDTILNAEFVNTTATSVILRGSTGAQDTVNTGEDAADVYGIAVDGTTDIVVESISLTSAFNASIRILDESGQTVAANSGGVDTAFGTTFRYRPTTPGVYYIAITHGTGVAVDEFVDLNYAILVSGLAPTTLGSYRSGLGLGSVGDNRATAADGFRERPVVVLNSGSAGSIRVGTGYVTGAGAEASAIGLINTFEASDDDIMQMSGFSFSAPGNLYNITAGGDINASGGGGGAPADFFVGQDFGSLYTGLSGVIGVGNTQGDISNFTLTTGGRIALIDIGGAIGADQDGNDGLPLGRLVGQNVVFRTGVDPDLSGDIGMIRVGAHVAGDILTIDTSAAPGSIVGGLLIAQDVLPFGNDGTRGDTFGIYDGFNGINLNLGQDSDIRFVDTPRIDLIGSQDASLPIITGETLKLVDDAGGRVEISVSSQSVVPVTVGRVIVVPVDGSEGVAIARIEIFNLAGTGVFTGGATLRIRGESGQSEQDVISIGRILIRNSDAFSAIDISGPAQIDVWRIDAPQGLNIIDQDTPGGDIVAIDTASLTTLRIQQGSLGQTQLPAWGPAQIGPNLGLAAGPVTTVEGALGATQLLFDNDFNGQAFRPTTDSNIAAGNAYLDDIGAPFDPYLNGLVVRTGGIQLVEVADAVGDIISQDVNGIIQTVRVNDDGTTATGEFDGIIGTIYSALDIDLIEIGDGLSAPTTSPIATSGIFAEGSIREISETNGVTGASINGIISASTNNGGVSAVVNEVGIDRIELTTGGSIKDSFIATTVNLDEFWVGVFYGNDGVFQGTINDIIVTDGDIFRSQITTVTLDNLQITGGFYDATDLNVVNDARTRISADGFRNSTADGTLLEFRISRILVGEDLEQLTVTPGGDISDTSIQVTGSVIKDITAANFIRANIGVNNIIESIDLTGNMLASSITAGQLVALTIGDSIRTSSISISGPLESLQVGNEISRTDITVSGPDGQIDEITVLNTIDANITSSGAIGTVTSTASDIRGTISTTTERGDVALISAFRDLAIETDIAGNLDQLVAGRNIGDADNRGVVLVRGDLGVLDVSGGRLFSDLRVGGSITTGVILGPVSNLPADSKQLDGDIEAFGRIESVTATGDFDGQIISQTNGIGNVTITNGSLLGEAAIIARDGGIGSVVIVAGHLLGDIFAEQSIGLVRVEASADGVFGDVGINPALSSGVASSDSGRNQLPPGVEATSALDGPTIAALRGINSIVVTNGSIFDAFIYAGTNIGSISVTGNVQSDGQQADDDSVVIAAGDQIQSVTVSGNATDTLFLAGVTSFGAMPIFNLLEPLYNDRPGGTGSDADTIKPGRIQSVSIGGNATDVAFSAGMTAGADGVYATGDEQHVLGLSFVNDLNISGTRTNVTVSADRKFYRLNGQVITPAMQAADATLNNAGRNAANADGLLEPLTAAFTGGSVNLANLGTVVNFGTTSTFTWNGTTFTLTATSTEAGVANADAGRGIIWDAARGRVILANTRMADGVTVTVQDDGNPNTPLPDLIDFDIVSNDDASIGLIRIVGDLRGGSDIIVDNYVRTIDIDDYDGTGQIRVGVDVGSLTVGRFAGGSISANFVQTLTVNQSLVVSGGSKPSISLEGVGTISIAQNSSATISIERSVRTGLFVGGSLAGTLFRAGGSLTSLTADSISRSRISVGDTIGSIDVVGNVFDSSILAGGDLGSDAEFGSDGSSSSIDHATSGNIGPVNIGGNFTQSDLVAGFLRGPDGFFGTADDTSASGISTIGIVTIVGSGFGSNVNSEAYAIASAGTLGFVSFAGQTGATSGNFRVDQLDGEPLPIQVLSFDVDQDARVYTASFSFNQDIDTSTFINAISIKEVLSEGNFIDLVNPTEGIPGSGDFSIEFDEADGIVRVTIDREITDRDLIDNGDGTFSHPPQAAAGVYRIELDANILRARISQARLDGNGDGFSTVGDDFSIDDIIGDAGDTGATRAPDRVDVNGDGSLILDFLAPVSLDQVLDSNKAPDGVPDVNTRFTIRGAMGDHPDRDLNDFGFGGDIDVYNLTLQAGQILKLGEMSGPAFQSQRSIYFQPASGGAPVRIFTQIGTGFSTNFFASGGGIETDQAIPLPVRSAQVTDRSDPAALLIKETGSYFIVVEAGSVPSVSWFLPGTVNNVENQPNQIGNYVFDVEIFDDGNSGFAADTDSGDGTNVVHAPPLSLFSNPDDTIIIDEFTFQRFAGADGVFGNNDDFVSGTSNDGQITSIRSGNRLTNTITSSLGNAGVSGLPGDVSSDVDIWHLNNGQGIAPGTAITITVKLADIGADLGSTLAIDRGNFTSLADFSNFAKNVQFALFDTTNATNIDDAELVFSPTDFSSRAGTPNTTIAQSGPNRYGFDANGDFFISFVVPPALGGAVNASGSYAVYLQGAFQSDYQLEVVTQGTGAQQVRSQNVLIETSGGTLDWLAVGDDPVTIGGFNADSLGFTGRVNNIPVNEYILSELTTRLNAIYAAAGLDVTFSTNPADFEFQEFSSVFLSNDHSPIGLIVASDFGFSEHSDPFNTDREDEAVVFAPDLSILGYTPSTSDLDDFIDSLTAATGRRVGELVGLRMTDPQTGAGDLDLFNENSVVVTPGSSDYIIPVAGRSLASSLSSFEDTGFYLGQQSASSLLDRILSN